MTEQEKEIFEKYCKLEEALKIAKDALNEIKYLPESIDDQASFFAVRALEQIDEVLK